MPISTDSALPENRVKISEDLRSMNVPTGEQVLGCVGDAWVRRVWFDMPRYCDGTDLSGYTLSVNYRNTDEDEDRYPVLDAVVNDDTITFSWLVGAVACAAPGLTSVSIKAQKLNGDTIEHEFNSTIYYFKVLPANTTGAEPLQEYSDAFTTLMLQWQAEVDEAVAEAPKGKLVGTASGTTPQTVNDAWPTTLESATLYGKCVQDGTPTPDNPVPVQVVSGTVNITINETVHAIDLQGHTLAGLPDGTRDELDIDAAGVKTIEQRTYRVKGSAFNWSIMSSPESHIFRATFETAGLLLPILPALGTRANFALSTAYRQKGYAPIAAADNGYFAIGLSGTTEHRLIVIDHRFSTVADFATAVADVEFVYELATPQTIELGTIELPELANPCELAIYASLDPEWAISYEQDPNAVITSLQASIAPVEGSTASANYAVNSYLIHGNQLYRVTSAIATGEAITPGSNCVACTVMGEVIRLTA